MAVAGTNVYLANSQDGLRIYDVSDPLSPINIGHAAITKLGSQLFTVAAAGDYAALKARDRRVFRVRADDLAAYAG